MRCCPKTGPSFRHVASDFDYDSDKCGADWRGWLSSFTGLQKHGVFSQKKHIKTTPNFNLKPLQLNW
jgi:hypothetical protein